MPNDPHRDALAAALARVQALEEENRELREQSPKPDLSTGLALRSEPPPNPEAINEAIDETLHHLSERLDTEKSPDEEQIRRATRADARQLVKCEACGGARTIEARVTSKLTVSLGVESARITRARVCADCGHVSLVLDERGRVWLQQNYLSALLSEKD